MKSLILKTVATASLVVWALTCCGTAGRAQSESKTFGKLVEGTNSVTVKTDPTPQVSHGVKSWKRQLEIVIYHSRDAENYYSDEHYSDQEAGRLRSALSALALRFREWRGKRLGTQVREIVIRKPDAGNPITVALQMDEMGHVAVVLTQGQVGYETDAAQLEKFRGMVSQAAAWTAANPGAGVGKKPVK